MSDSLPSRLNLKPESRWPLKLRLVDIEAVLARPVSCLTQPGTGHDTCRQDELISIVVVSFNNLVFNRLCLESVLLNSDSMNYELIVVDNGSNDGTVEYLLELESLNDPVRVLRNGKNMGFAAASNRGLEAANGEILVLLNNDIVTPPHWLDGLTQRLENPHVGMVGPVTNRCGNEAQIKAPYTTYGELLTFASSRALDHVGTDREIRMLTMFCVAMRKDTFVKIGPLDERFEVGLFEDEDYARRLRDAGYKLLCAEDVFVHHFGQASIGKLATNDQYGQLFRLNRDRFEKKWGCQWRPHDRRHDAEYQGLVTKIRDTVESSIPIDAIVAIASKGDEDLLTVVGRRAWHFPQDETGLYAGFHPADSESAIRHLNHLREQGAAFLLLPAPMFWWLQYYPGLAHYLASHFPCVSHDDFCLIYQLSDLPLIQSGSAVTLYNRAKGLDRLNRDLVTIIVLADDDCDRTRKFLNVLLSYCQHPHRLLLMAQTGIDSVTMSSLNEFVDRHDHIVLTETSAPGAVAAINIGCKLAPGDVVILKSDCKLSDQWLEKLSACALNQDAVSTISAISVTPPETGVSPSTSTIETSCIYVTRAALRRVGLFDERRFSDLSAALEDFSIRATSKGFVHLINDAIFKACDISELSACPEEYAGGFKKRAEKSCVLALVHNASGGTRFATEDLVIALGNYNRCLLLETGISEWFLYEVLDGQLSLTLRFGFANPWRVDVPSGKDRLAVLQDICESFNVDLVNTHHLLCSGPDIMGLFQELCIPVVFSFHDYYSLCPTSHLIDAQGRNCLGACTDGTRDCPLNETFFRDPLPVLKHDYVYEHRKRMESGLGKCHAYTAPSQATKSLLEQSLPGLRKGDFHIVEHGRSLGRKRLGIEPTTGRPVKLVCLGNLNTSKGINLIQELMRLDLARGHRFEFHFLGGLPGDFRPEDSGGVHHGSYHREELFDWIGKIGPSFSLCASICEETHSFTLTESWAAGLPVFASGLGALRERIEKHGGGWLFNPNDAGGFLNGMTTVIDTPGAWLKEVENVNSIPIRTVATEARVMNEIFKQSLSGEYRRA